MEFHEGEYEILLPERVSASKEMPFVLSVGPNLTMLLPVILMALLASKIYGSNQSFMYMTLITGGTAGVMGIVWGISNYVYRKNSKRKELKEREDEFNRYLIEVRKTLQRWRDDNKEFLENRYPPSRELLNNVDKAHLFKRYEKDKDFLFVRLCYGTIPFQVNVKICQDKKTMFPTADYTKALEVSDDFKEIEKAPTGIELKKEQYIGIDLPQNEGITYERIMSIIIQICHSVSPSKLKLCIFYDEKDNLQSDMVSSCKWLPHIWTENGKRLLCGSRSSLNKTVPNIERLISQNDIILIVLILDDGLIREENMLSSLVFSKENDNVFILYLKEKDFLPNRFKRIIDSTSLGILDNVPIEEARIYGRNIAALIEPGKSESEEIPRKVDFLWLYGVKKIEDISVEEFWLENNPKDRLKAPIGIGAGGRKIYLDVHEKFHGPHGLIAGTTGAGKSELLQTYLISLCIMFSPSLVNFFLIDYKGGGTGNYISELPHCAGTISNLSGNQIGRAMKAIVSENKRRQQILSDSCVNHIDSYQQLYMSGKAKDPLPHLILIIDEFAELKKEAPDFMAEIISLAAQGRSLGIHLILATQKPAGVVDDKIWSNSNFKLCLKVQDRQDSMDMLHRPEAAYLTDPGQCYIQVGNDEYFEQFQAGYCGGYIENPDDLKNKVFIVDETGERKGVIRDTDTQNRKRKLEALVSYINDIAEKVGEIRARPLWMPELPEIIPPDNKPLESDEGFWLGLYDDPQNQRTGNIYYLPQIHGHLGIVGGACTGKTTFLKRIISQIPDEDEILLLDISQSGIHEFSNRSNVLGILEKEEDIDIFFYHLSKEFDERKKCKTQGSGCNTRLFIFIDNFSFIFKSLSDSRQELLLRMISQGIGQNVYFIISGNSISDFSQKIFSKLKTTFSLELNDSILYGDVLRKYRINVIPKPNVPGRCLCLIDGEIYEGQIALPCTEEVRTLTERTKKVFPRIPDRVLWRIFEADISRIFSSENERTDFLPIGYSMKSGIIRGIRLENANSFLIMSGPGDGGNELLEGIKMTLISFLKFKEEEIYEYKGGEIDEKCVVSGKLKAILVWNIAELSNRLYNTETSIMVKQFFENSITQTKNSIFISGICDPLKEMEILTTRFFRNLACAGQGIYMGGNVSTQRVFDFSDLSYSQSIMSLKKGEGFMKIKGVNKSVLVKTVLRDEEDEEDDID